ncbi:hypothetical protein BH18ACI5_BH18ACI5_04480 [soil metagenome]
MARVKHTPAAIARQLVSSHINDFLSDDLTAWLENEHFDSLQRALYAAKARHTEVLTLKQVVQLQTEIQNVLPPDIVRTFIRLSDWTNVERLIAMETGFLIGLEMGRRLREEAA